MANIFSSYFDDDDKELKPSQKAAKEQKTDQQKNIFENYFQGDEFTSSKKEVMPVEEEKPQPEKQSKVKDFFSNLVSGVKTSVKSGVEQVGKMIDRTNPITPFKSQYTDEQMKAMDIDPKRLDPETYIQTGTLDKVGQLYNEELLLALEDKYTKKNALKQKNQLSEKEQQDYNKTVDQISEIEQVLDEPIGFGTLLKKENTAKKYALGRYARSAKTGVVGAAKGIMGVASWFQEVQYRQREQLTELGITPRGMDIEKGKKNSEWLKQSAESIREKTKGIQRYIDETQVSNPTLGESVTSGVASSAPFLVMGGITSKLTSGGLKTVAFVNSAFESAQIAGDVYEDNRQSGKSIDESSLNFQKVFIENLAINYVLDRFGILNEEGKNTIVRGFRSASAEGVQEMYQTVIQNVYTDQDPFLGIVESGVIGGIVGAGFSVVIPTGEVIKIDESMIKGGGTEVQEEKPVDFIETVKQTGDIKTETKEEEKPVEEQVKEDKSIGELTTIEMKDLTEPGVTKNPKRLKEILKTKENAEKIEKGYQSQLEEANERITNSGIDNASTRDINNRRDAADALDTIRNIKDELPSESELIETKEAVYKPTVISEVVTNSFLKTPELAELKPNRLQEGGVSLQEAETGLAKNGKDLSGRITLGLNDSGELILTDGTHLLEAYRRIDKDIPANKVKFDTPEAEVAYRKAIGSETVIKDNQTRKLTPEEIELVKEKETVKPVPTEEETKAKPKKLTKTAQKKEALAKAKELGIKAFNDGKKAVASQDKDFMEALKIKESNIDSEAFIRAWIDGWNEANLSGDIIGDNEETTDQDTRGDDRSGQRADTVPESEEQPERVGETTEIVSGEVARGVSESGDTSTRERSTARIEVGDRVSWYESGNLLTGTVDLAVEGRRVIVKVDQIETIGGVPIFRSTTVSIDKLTLIEDTLTTIDPTDRVFNLIQTLNSPLDDQAEAEWTNELDEFVKLKGKEQEEFADAFINKWESKAREYTKPVTTPKRNQVDINQEIENLVKLKGTGQYTQSEKELLRQYTGSGGLETQGAEGRGLLDEYYTPKPIIDFIWNKVSSLKGKEKGSILEPSVGIGRFLEQDKFKGKVTAYEINPVSANITGILHPNATVITQPFESNFIDKRGNKIDAKLEYDLVIGNPPYGEHRGKYLGLGEEPKIVKYEEYFLKRGLDVLNEDGLLTYVIPSSFLRGGNSYAKSEITKLGQLVDAYRLPNGAFGTTTIGTDIVFIRKIPTDNDTGRHADRAILMSNDRWFENNPDKILGNISVGTGNYGADEVKGSLEDAIAKAESMPVVVEDTIDDVDLKENIEEMGTEVQESEEAVKSSEEPPKKRVPENPVTTNELNKKAIIIPNKKDTTIRLSEGIVPGEMDMWKNVNVTGELSEAYTLGYDPKTFTSESIAIYKDANGKYQYQPNVLYYQGDIYKKLDELTLMKSEISSEQYDTQRQGLEKVLPTPKKINEIQLQPNSDFIHNIRVDSDVFGRMQDTRILDMFEMWFGELPYAAFSGSSQWEIRGYIEGSVVNTGDKIQNIEVRKRRREVGNELFKRFVEEQLTAEQRQKIEGLYNRSFNAYHKPDYKDVPIISEINANFNPKKKPGKHPLVVKGVQKEGAAFLATKGVGLLGYDVGVGKTMTAIIAINEVMKKGWAKRPLLIVPNGVYRNWINEISEVIPDIKINSLMNLGAAFKGDLKSLQVEEGTLSIITYDGLAKLGFKDETYEQLTGELQDVMSGMNTTKRGKAKEEAQIEQQIGKAIKGTTGDRYFEDLGFDHITIDEVHNFKNIFAGAKIERGKGNEYRNVRGSSSARGIKAYLMAQYVLRENNNRNVFLLSATPFSNSPLEIYSILSLMGKKRLEEIGLKNVNDFMSMYMELKPTFVVKADQSVKEEDVIEKFQNLQELQKMVTEFIDFRTGEEAGVDRPGRIKRTITLNPTKLQNDYTLQAQKLFTSKDGGAIVAITELQNIALSPYLSRYSSGLPTYKEFVDNSPKIKFAVEAIAQTHKDNKNVGQVLYMPRGVDQFPLIVEYLVKEKGFKASEIGVVSGGMTINNKQEIQDKFNAGSIKVLIGTEAIKEGVNLQERSTDLYHLHLPWNPTDMLQVEGRIWRQGNDYANVRIHYPLIENSVDSFIFQKLETKEKRIKNLWSYKDNEINVGDLDFENMKLDLITDPEVRVKAEKTFEEKKETQKLTQLKTEKAFSDRKIEKLAKALDELSSAKENLKEREVIAKEEPDSYTASNMDYYRKRVMDLEKDVSTARKSIQKEGLDVAELEKKSKAFAEKITEQEKVIQELNEKYAEKIKEAIGKEYKAKEIPNNYFVLTKEIANENATFFKKRAGQDVVRASNTSYKTPSGTADVGGYADIETATKTVSNLKTVEFPELLRIVQELTGQTPTLKSFTTALGKFYSSDGSIRLSPDLWQTPKLASKVLAHELGHLADYLPDKTLLRGNILGRIATLNKYLKGHFSTEDSVEISNADIRAELKELSQAWKPFDELQDPNYTSYRFSSKELYADAISVLFNDPSLLKEKAPTFWTAFFEYLDTKPEVKTVFNETWNVLNKGEEAVFDARNKAIDKAYEKAEEIWAIKTMEKHKRKVNIFETLRVLFDNKNYKLYKQVSEQQKKNVKVEDALNPMFAFEGLSYLDGKIKNFVADNFQEAFIKAAEVDGGWDMLGKILQMERVIYERGEFANPMGFDPETATAFIEKLEKNTEVTDWTKIQEAKAMFRSGMDNVVKLAKDNGYYKPELIEKMEHNPAYATFQVIDYLDTYISASIKHQIGTLKDVANPATSSVMKAIATMKAVEYNNAKKSAVDFERDFHKDEVELAKRVYTGKTWQIVDSKDPEKGTVVIIRNGTPEGYYVDKDLAEIFNTTSSSAIMMGAKLSRMLTGSGVYRAIFTQLNLGFQTFNFLARDLMRYWKNVPDFTLERAILSLPRAIYRYGQAIPHAYKSVLNKPDAIIKEMENAQMLGLTYNDMFQSGNENEQQQIERIMKQAGVMQSSRKRGLLTPIFWLYDGTTALGNMFERIPKIAGYIDLKGSMPEKELASFIRNYVGSPNFRAGGTLTPITNNIFLFSNAYKEGIKSDLKIATTYKTSTGYRTAGGFWWKTILRTILPKALMLALALGFGGDELKKLLENVSEYDKTNYDIIPFGFDENGKTVYMRIPQDETGRFLGGLFWKASKALTKADKLGIQDIFQVVDFGAGQVPNLVPSLEGMGHLLTYFSGRNPYDTFRGRNVLTDDEFNAGFSTSFPIFMDWFAKQQGLGIVMPTYTPQGAMTDLEEVIYKPVVSNILGRWIKVSDYGRTEVLREVAKPEEQEAAKRRQDEKKLLTEAVKEYYEGSHSVTRKMAIKKQLIKDVVGEPPYDKTEKARRTNLEKKFNIAIVKKTADPNVQSLIYATTNAQKVALLKEIKKDMSMSEFNQLRSLLLSEKIVSKEVFREIK